MVASHQSSGTRFRVTFPASDAAVRELHVFAPGRIRPGKRFGIRPSYSTGARVVKFEADRGERKGVAKLSGGGNLGQVLGGEG
jgi:hypothetical protein